MIIAILILLGLCFGSFVNAFVWRLHEQHKPKKQRKAGDKELSITKGRSMCVHCGHTLQTLDLIPVLSWLSLAGKCRYCKKSISPQYPLVELGTAALFVGSYFFWPNRLAGWENAAFALWLVCLTGFMALIIYDLRWMLLPNKIVFSLYGVAGLFIIAKLLSEKSPGPVLSALAGVLIGGGIFYLLFTISKGKWIGGGDVKLGFLLGALVGGPANALLVLFLASLLGSALALPLVAAGRAKRTTRIPFGPFLIIAAIIVQLFGSALTAWYVKNFIDI